MKNKYPIYNINEINMYLLKNKMTQIYSIGQEKYNEKY